MHHADLTVGRVIECGSRQVTGEEIVEFARRYDPQPFHVDPESPAAARWGGLIASGFMVCSVAMDLVARTILNGSASAGSPGVEQVRWEAPVRPGDVVSVRVTVLEQRLSSSGQYSVVRWLWEMHNQHGKRVMQLTGTSLFHNV
jgi:acyl dehydratase